MLKTTRGCPLEVYRLRHLAVYSRGSNLLVRSVRIRLDVQMLLVGVVDPLTRYSFNKGHVSNVHTQLRVGI